MPEKQITQSLPVFGDLEPDLAQHINKRVKFIELAPNQTLFLENDEADFMFFVISGKLKVLRQSDDKDVYVRDLDAGESGGITSLFLTQPRSATVIASEPTKLATLSKVDLDTAMTKHPEIGHGLLRILSRQVRSSGKSMAHLMKGRLDGEVQIAVFDAKSYDRDALTKVMPEDWHLHFIDPRLNRQTATLAAGCTIACIFVNDVADRDALEILADVGVEMIALRCSGFNNVDLPAARRLGISVARVPVYSPYAVAEHAIALLLALNRKVHRAYQRVREGNFTLSGLEGFDLHGRTAAVLGVGGIGKVLVKNLQGFGMKVVGWDAYPSEQFAEETGMEYVSFEEAIKVADVISLHAPLTKDTYHLIDDKAISTMKDGVILINTSRGGLVDHEALISALKSGKIGAAGLDVYEEEAGVFFEDLSARVIADDVLARLLSLTNVIITSHQAYLTTDALHNIASTTAGNINEFLDGKRFEELTNYVDVKAQ